MKEYIATFYSHYGAVSFKRHCEKRGFAATLMPVPRNLSSSCGTCVRFTAEKEPLPEINEELEQIVEVMKDGYKKVFQTDGM